MFCFRVVIDTSLGQVSRELSHASSSFRANLCISQLLGLTNEHLANSNWKMLLQIQVESLHKRLCSKTVDNLGAELSEDSFFFDKYSRIKSPMIEKFVLWQSSLINLLVSIEKPYSSVPFNDKSNAKLCTLQSANGRHHRKVDSKPSWSSSFTRA